MRAENRHPLFLIPRERGPGRAFAIDRAWDPRYFAHRFKTDIRMTALTPLLFDRPLQRKRLARAQALGPADFLLNHAADGLIERLGVIKRDFARVLDLGTPSPRLAEALAARSRAAEIIRVAPLEATSGKAPILALVGDEEALPLGPELGDLAVSALALQHVNDLPGALVQIRRALKPDGLFLACLLGGQSLTELRMALGIAESEVSGGVSPRVAPFADVRDMGALLQRAGFALPVVDSEPISVRYETMFGLLADLRAMGATNVLTARLKKPAPRRLFLRAAEIYAQRFADADGRVRATFELIHVSGWAPHESQQKPLRPGTARMRLADALGATETRLKDDET
jgi:SAM-dependent methyltransferase